ncbi:MAG: glutamate--tRNA ligase, partial [Thermodesulfobacteriota bacterium]
LINYLARLGWAYGDQEIFTIDELIERFTLENVGKASGVFNPEKLAWLNAHYIKTAEPKELAPLLVPFLKKNGYDAASDERLPKVIETLQERATTLAEMAEGAGFYFRDDFAYDEKAAGKFLKPETAPLLQLLIGKLEALPEFNAEAIQGVFEAIMKERDLKLGKVAQPVRVALTGGTVSPGIFETIEALGREKTLERLKKAIGSIQNTTLQDTHEEAGQER